jgi:DNA polymerase V
LRAVVYANQATVVIEPTADSLALIRTATRAAAAMWRDGYRYQKTGIVLLDLYQSAGLPVADLFASFDPEKSKALMAALDPVNGRFGRNTLRPGAVAATPTWACDGVICLPAIRRGRQIFCAFTPESTLLIMHAAYMLTDSC